VTLYTPRRPKRATGRVPATSFNALLAEGLPIVVAADQHHGGSEDHAKSPRGPGWRRKWSSRSTHPDPPPQTGNAARDLEGGKAWREAVAVPDLPCIAYVAEHLVRASGEDRKALSHRLIAHAVLTGKRLAL